MQMPPQFVVPVNKLKRPKKDNPITGTELLGRATYYENDGKLPRSWRKQRWDTLPIYFIQSSDGEMYLVNQLPFEGASVVEALQPFFYNSKKRQVIRFDLPVKNSPIEFYTNNDSGIRYFISMHHPDQQVRTLAINNAAHLAPMLDIDPKLIDQETALRLCDELKHQH